MDNIIRMEPVSEQKRSPLVWIGGKGRFVEQLSIAMPGDIDFFIDAFVGGGSLSFHLLRQTSRKVEPSKMILNDLNAGLIDFYKNIQTESRGKLIRELLGIHSEYVGNNRVLFDLHKDKKSESGLSFYIHNRLSYNGAQGPNLNFCKSEQRASTSFTRSEIRKLHVFGQCLEGVEIRNGDYYDLEPLSNKTLIYGDSPYGARKGARNKEYYGFDFEQKRYLEWCNRKKDQCYVMVCHADTPEVIAMFKGWHIYRVPKTGKGPRSELVITSYEISHHKFKFLKDDYGWEYIGVPFPDKEYDVLYMDAPWPYHGDQSKDGAAANHYGTMTLDELKALPVADIIAKKAVCFMWVTESSKKYANELFNAYGLTMVDNSFIWQKVTKADGKPFKATGGIPTIVKPVVEYLYIGTTEKDGTMPWAGISRRCAKLEQVIQAPRGRHSEKPAVFRKMIENIFGTDRSYIELFARRNSDELWDCWGNEVGKFPDDMEEAA